MFTNCHVLRGVEHFNYVPILLRLKFIHRSDEFLNNWVLPVCPDPNILDCHRYEKQKSIGIRKLKSLLQLKFPKTPILCLLYALNISNHPFLRKCSSYRLHARPVHCTRYSPTSRHRLHRLPLILKMSYDSFCLDLIPLV